MQTTKSFQEVIKKPKGGYIAMDYFGLQALGAESLSHYLGIRSEVIYDYLIRYNINVSDYGHILSTKDNVTVVLDEIINDRFVEVKSLLGL